MVRALQTGKNAGKEWSDVPYGGLLGDTVLARVMEELIADPHSFYRSKDLEELTGCTSPSIREALKTLREYGLVTSSGDKHPVHSVNIHCKTFIALTLLAYAVLDDQDDGDCMDTAIRHYCETTLNIDQGFCTTAVSAPYRISDQARMTGSAHDVSANETYLCQHTLATEG